ncbi:ENTH domain-containing protein C794.11c isoform X2 [Asparagus officinalis]|nr:ENTH domain-containing protein C794.11c isoform X2 [Asparagus officinalis]
MTRISEAAYDNDEYWRIIDVIHRRLRYVNYKEWRQSYKTLVLLEFLLTHGPEDIFEEFHCDSRVIGELGKMNYVDERGFNWGACMKKKSQKILKLLMDEDYLAEERSKALTISKEIQGFGNLIISPTASSPSPSSSSSRTSRASSFGSYSTCDSPSWSKREELIKSPKSLGKEIEGLHLWDNPIEENGPLVETKNEDVKGKSPIWSTRGLYTRFAQNRGYALRSLSDIGRVVKKKVDRQLSLGR